MWSPARQLNRICSPFLQAATKMYRVPIAAAGPFNAVQRCTFHVLAVAGLRKSLAPQHKLSSPIAVDLQPGMVCDPLTHSSTAVAQPSCGFKLKRVLKRRCKDCYFVVRENRLHVICKTHPRHKQMAIVKPEKSNWILTHATQSPVRPY